MFSEKIETRSVSEGRSKSGLSLAYRRVTKMRNFKVRNRETMISAQIAGRARVLEQLFDPSPVICQEDGAVAGRKERSASVDTKLFIDRGSDVLR